VRSRVRRGRRLTRSRVLAESSAGRLGRGCGCRGATYALARFFVNLEGVGGKIYGLGGVVSVVSAVT
jgi:hypothetical protein